MGLPSIQLTEDHLDDYTKAGRTSLFNQYQQQTVLPAALNKSSSTIYMLDHFRGSGSHCAVVGRGEAPELVP